KHAGDYATPEGRYKISKKNPSSRYYKALLIDYPNASDRQAYVRNQQDGLVPSGVGIGGTIEIHGGGNDVITDGCVSMKDQEMDMLYKLADVGTAVTIIGSKKSLKSILEQVYEH
ncbi:MAG: L,D-transpeptidase family protein, partial [Acidobacteriota bacterium]